MSYSGITFSSVWLSVDQTLCKTSLLCHCLHIWNFLVVIFRTPLNPGTLEKDTKAEKDLPPPQHEWSAMHIEPWHLQNSSWLKVWGARCSARDIQTFETSFSRHYTLCIILLLISHSMDYAQGEVVWCFSSLAVNRRRWSLRAAAGGEWQERCQILLGGWGRSGFDSRAGSFQERAPHASFKKKGRCGNWC